MVSGIGFESNWIVGAVPCPDRTPPVTASAAAIEKISVRFMWPPYLAAAEDERRLHLRWTQNDLLRAPCRDLRHEQLIRIAAVDLVNGAELAKTLARLAELSDDLAVQLHLVDLAGDRP